MPSKYPSKYRIDLHVDDDLSVAQNGGIYGFNVHIIGGQDADNHNTTEIIDIGELDISSGDSADDERYTYL